MQLNITTEGNKICYPICFGSFSAIIMSPSSVKHITGLQDCISAPETVSSAYLW